MAELTFELHSPMTEEEWDLITDVDLDHTPSVIFHTKHGKDVEYVKVKHGHWIRRLDTRFGRLLNDIIICSNCNIAFSSEQQIRRSYCPNCGARMDGGEE